MQARSFEHRGGCGCCVPEVLLVFYWLSGCSMGSSVFVVDGYSFAVSCVGLCHFRAFIFRRGDAVVKEEILLSC